MFGDLFAPSLVPQHLYGKSLSQNLAYRRPYGEKHSGVQKRYKTSASWKVN